MNRFYWLLILIFGGNILAKEFPVSIKNIESDYKIVSVMAVNNETGIIQPLEEVSKFIISDWEFAYENLINDKMDSSGRAGKLTVASYYLLP